MTRTYYELLDLPGTATLDDIKRNFRREIAKYHPDKVQHLGREFQDIAAVKAAELTQAYKTLSDDVLRADYDAQLAADAVPVTRESGPAAAAVQAEPRHQASPATPAPPVEPAQAPAPAAASAFSQDRAASSDLIMKATVMRFRSAVHAEFGSGEEVSVPGFEVACAPKPSFWTRKLPPCVLGCFVAQVNAAAVTESWAQAARMTPDGQRDLVVFVMGPAVAPAGELAAAISEQRRKPVPAGRRLVLVPVNTRNWTAHVPNDAPPVVKSLLTRLKSA